MSRDPLWACALTPAFALSSGEQATEGGSTRDQGSSFLVPPPNASLQEGKGFPCVCQTLEKWASCPAASPGQQGAAVALGRMTAQLCVGPWDLLPGGAPRLPRLQPARAVGLTLLGSIPGGYASLHLLLFLFFF